MIKNSIIRKYSVTLAMIVVLALVLPLKACAKEQMLVEEPDGIITMTTKASKVSFIVAGAKDVTIDWGDGKKSNENDAILDGISEWLYFNHDYSAGTTAFNIVITGNVTLLYCGGNGLTALDVSKNTALEELRCDHNQLTALDVSKNATLNSLDCNFNQIKGLDVSKNTALGVLSVVGNQLTAFELNDLFKTLPDYSKTDGFGVIYISRYSGAGNPGNSDCDRSIARERGWSFMSIRQ